MITTTFTIACNVSLFGHHYMCVCFIYIYICIYVCFYFCSSLRRDGWRICCRLLCLHLSPQMHVPANLMHFIDLLTGPHCCPLRMHTHLFQLHLRMYLKTQTLRPFHDRGAWEKHYHLKNCKIFQEDEWLFVS